MDIKNSEMLVESKTLRCEVINKIDVLDKVKKLSMLPDDLHITIEMAATYYEVDIKIISKTIQRNKEELEADGISVLTGQRLSDFKSVSGITKRMPSLTLIPKRAILRIGMLLRDSEVAKQVRTHLLDTEEQSKTNIVQIPTELNMFGQLIEGFNQSFKVMTQMQYQLNATEKTAITANKIAAEANERNKELETELNDIKRGLVDVEIPLRSQFNDAVRKYAGKNKMEFEDAYNHVYEIVGKQHHVNIKTRVKNRQDNGEKVKPIDVLEELNLLVPAIRIAKALSGVTPLRSVTNE